MNIVKKVIVQPMILASGVSLFLYAHNQELPLSSYLCTFPYWILIGRPLGLTWNNKFLKKMNEGVFPQEMKNYRELYLVSSRAITYDIIFNHTIYQSIFAVALMTFAYGFRRLDQTITSHKQPNQTLFSILTKSAPKLIQMRALISIFSIVSQYTFGYLFMKKNSEGIFEMKTSNKRFLLTKQLILGVCWNSYVLKVLNENYIRNDLHQE